MKNIDRDIKDNNLKSVYLIYGEENFLKRVYKDKLKKAIIGEDASMNYNYYENNDINPNEVIDVAETLPFFADKRLIVIKNSGFFKNACDIMADYMLTIPESTCFLFLEDEIDKRSKMYKRVKDSGYVCEAVMLRDGELNNWIKAKLAHEGKNINNEALNCIKEMAATSMDNMIVELEKVICYAIDRDTITKEDVEEVCTGQIQGKIFDMVDAMGMKNQQKALELYYDLVQTKEAPLKILFMILRQFNLMLQAYDLNKRGVNDIGAKMGVQGFVATKSLKQAQLFKYNRIKQILEEGLTLEEDIKSGRIADKTGVEVMIVKCSEKV